MKKEKKPAVYELILHMDRAEKGYFIKFANMLGKGSNYATIFGILSEMEQYDKETLLLKMKKKQVHTTNLNVTLHHLYAVVVKSLRLYHEKNYPRIQLGNFMSEAEVLIGKNLKEQAVKVLQKAEDWAVSHHMFGSVIEIQKSIAIQKMALTRKGLMEEVEKQYEKIEKNIEGLKQEIKARRLHHISLALYRINDLDARHCYKSQMQELNKMEINNDVIDLHSFYPYYYTLGTATNRALIDNERLSAHIYYQKLIIIWERHPKMLKAYPINYLNCISNYLVNAIFIKKVEDFEGQIHKLENIPTRFLNDKIELFQSKLYLQQLHYLNNNQLDKAYQLISINEKKLNKYAPRMNFSRLTTIQYNYLLICFLLGKNQEGILWLNQILYERKAEPRKNVRLFCRIMELVLHYELENYDLVESLIRSVWRIRKVDVSFQSYAECILQHFKIIIKSSMHQLDQNYRQFKKDLSEFIIQSPKPVGAEELTIWLEAKINKMNIVEAYQKILSKEDNKVI